MIPARNTWTRWGRRSLVALAAAVAGMLGGARAAGPAPAVPVRPELYYFATHDMDPQNIPGTALAGRELRAALGGALTARAVFLFADTCHSGGLSGRNDDLALEVGDGVYMLASSGAREFAFESPAWGHGAFTLALLRALDRRELAKDGLIYFNALTFAVPDEVAALMKEVGRNESEQEPIIPVAARRLRVPITQAR